MSNTIRTGFDTSTYNVLLKEGYLRKLFDDTQREKKVFYKEIVNDLTTKDQWILDQRMAGLTGATELVEGQNIPSQKPVMGGQKKYTQRRFGTGFRMTDWMLKFNKHGLWNRWAKDLAKVHAESKDIEVHIMFNNPTSASLTCGTGYDSLAMAHDTHTGLLAGSTTDNYDNKLSAALSYSALESARYYFATLKDDLGMLMSANPTHLVFEPTLYPTVQEILRSDYKPHEMSNTTNVFKDYIKTYEDRRLTSTTMWFMIDKSEGYDINVFTSFEPDFVTQDAPDTSRDRIVTSQTYFTYGWGSPKKYYLGNT
jgi:hypothetical protein